MQKLSPAQRAELAEKVASYHQQGAKRLEQNLRKDDRALKRRIIISILQLTMIGIGLIWFMGDLHLKKNALRDKRIYNNPYAYPKEPYNPWEDLVSYLAGVPIGGRFIILLAMFGVGLLCCFYLFLLVRGWRNIIEPLFGSDSFVYSLQMFWWGSAFCLFVAVVLVILFIICACLFSLWGP